MGVGIQQVEEIGSLLPQGGSWDLNSGLQAWQHMPLPTKPSHLPQKHILCKWASDTKIPVMIRDQDKPVCTIAGTCLLFSSPMPLQSYEYQCCNTHAPSHHQHFLIFWCSLCKTESMQCITSTCEQGNGNTSLAARTWKNEDTISSTNHTVKSFLQMATHLEFHTL